MTQLLPGSTVTSDAESAVSAVGSTQRSQIPILVTEQELSLSTAAAISVPLATSGHRWWPGATLTAAIGRILTLPEPGPHYVHREANYFETARMSRAMDHL